MILSRGNIKLGKIPNISLPPIATCGCLAEHCGTHCYARKAYRQYPDTRNAWNSNLEEYIANPEKYFLDLYEKLRSKRKLTHFRWHVGGEIVDEIYFLGIISVAAKLPKTKFLVFTKKYSFPNIYYTLIPSNLQVILSAWPGLPLENPYKLPVAFMQDGTETRLDGTEIECPGSCETCSDCFDLGSLKRNVVFKLH